jgi:uncharacterized protein YcsI (UPF0317 family)
VPAYRVAEVVALTQRYPLAHGAPVHIGAPEAIGVDLQRPDHGDVVRLEPGDVPVFWGCGVTPQYAAVGAQVEWMITHAPGRPLVTDLKLDDLDLIRGAEWMRRPGNVGMPDR